MSKYQNKKYQNAVGQHKHVVKFAVQSDRWMDPKGPNNGAKGCSSPQELEKARGADQFFS